MRLFCAFLDRMIIKGHIRQFFSTSGKGYFLSEQNVLLKDFSAYANQVTSGIVAHVEAMAEETHRPLRYLTSAKIPKEQTALEILKNDPVDEGLICILSVVEYCQTLQPLKNRDGKLELRNVDRKCKYYYFYYLDKHFGFMHVKLQTWFPFLIQVYINGREMMKLRTGRSPNAGCLWESPLPICTVMLKYQKQIFGLLTEHSSHRQY